MMNLDTLRREIDHAQTSTVIQRKRLEDLTLAYNKAQRAFDESVRNLKNLQELLRVEEQRIYGETTV